MGELLKLRTNILELYLKSTEEKQNDFRAGFIFALGICKDEELNGDDVIPDRIDTNLYTYYSMLCVLSASGRETDECNKLINERRENA